MIVLRKNVVKIALYSSRFVLLGFFIMIYIVDGKMVDTKKLVLIYADGRWSDVGINYYTNKKQNSFYIERWSNWQGAKNSFKKTNKENFINQLMNEEHDERIIQALGEINVELVEIDY